MKGKVILELEEYEDLVRKNTEQIELIIKRTDELNKAKVDFHKELIIERVKYYDGYTEYFAVQEADLFKKFKTDFIKNTSVLKFIKLKRGRK